MYFDRFDICEAYYLFAMLWHSGGDTEDQIFWRLHRMEFRPSPLLGRRSDLTENGQAIFDNLETIHPASRNHPELHGNT